MAQQDAFGEQARSIELLWGKKGEPSRGPKPGLSVKQIALAAIEIANAEGLEAVSMQRVAQACGVTTMALYRYVPSKADLVALMIDVGIGEPPALDGIAGGWRPQLEEWARQIWAAFQRGTWSLEVTAPARLMGPNELGWFEAAIGTLSGTGLSGGEMVDAVIVVLSHVRSVAQYTADSARRQRGGSGDHWGRLIADVLDKHGARFPALRAALAEGAFTTPPGDPLEFGLRVVLDGIAMRIAERRNDLRGETIMRESDYSLKPIGFLRSSLKQRGDAPRQGREGAPDAWLDVDGAVAEGLEGIAVGDEVIVITWLHQAQRDVLKVHPRSDETLPLAGIFATRSPDRPNPLGLHRVTVLEIAGKSIKMGPIEAIDGTPVVDIKPVLSRSADV